MGLVCQGVSAEVYSGTCGAAGNEANVTWEVDTEDGSLYIKGTGAMTHYWSLTDIPWYAYRQYITRIYVSVTAIGHHAFYDCSNVTEISLSNSLTSIGVLSFGFCRKLTTLEIPVNVASIGDQALWYNESLRDVHVKWTGDAVPTMPANIHNFEASQIRLHIPCGQTAAYVAKGWNTKFALVEGLSVGTMETTTYFPWVLTCDSIWKVSGTGALNDFPNPLYVDLGIARVTINGSKLSPVFSRRNTVKGAVFEEGITYIGNNTFFKGTYHAGYPYLTTLTLPSTLTSMSSTAFKGCIALRDVYVSWTTAAAIPTWDQSIDVSQATLHVPCGTKSLYQAKSGWQNFIIREERGHGTCGAEGKNLTWTLSCDGTLTIRGTGGMYNWMSLAERPWHSLCTSIQRVVIEEGVTTTGYHAFYGASNLTSVSLPSTLQTLQFMTFFGCGKLTTLTIPSSVTYVGNRSLEGCSALTDVYMSETGDAIPTMPAGIHTYDASRIKLHIPCGQTAAYAAKGWNTKFILLEGSASGTCGTTGHESDVIWSLCDGTLTIQGTGAMADWSSSDKVPWYSYRSSITTVNIRDGVTSVGNRAFIDCAVLTSVTIPNSVTSISNNAFFSCSALTDIAIPNSVTTIGQYVFYGSSALTNITIPNSVTSLGESIFRNCSALTDMYVSWTTAVPDWPTNFTNKSPQSSITLHVPCEAIDLYQAADGWKDYTIEGEGTYIITVETDDPNMGSVDAVKVP